MILLQSSLNNKIIKACFVAWLSDVGFLGSGATCKCLKLTAILQLYNTLLELELPRVLAPDLPSNWSSLRDLNCTHSNYKTTKKPCIVIFCHSFFKWQNSLFKCHNCSLFKYQSSLFKCQNSLFKWQNSVFK